MGVGGGGGGGGGWGASCPGQGIFFPRGQAAQPRLSTPRGKLSGPGYLANPHLFLSLER